MKQYKIILSKAIKITMIALFDNLKNINFKKINVTVIIPINFINIFVSVHTSCS